MTGRYGWLPDLPDHRDILYKISQPRKLPASADLRSALPAPWDQGQLGSCTGNATAAALAYGRAMQSLPFIVPSRLMLYYNARALEGTTATDVGAQIRDVIKAAADLGACSEDLWPYDEAQFATPPDQAAVAAALKDRAIGYRRVPQDMTSIRTCLAEGDPIVFGFCLHGDTLIHTPSGDRPIKELVGKRPWVFAWSGDELKLAKARRVWKTKSNAKCLKVTYSWKAHGETKIGAIICTGTHPFLMLDGEYTAAGSLRPGDRLTPFSQKIGTPGPVPYKRFRASVKISGLRKGTGAWQKRSHWVWEQLNGPRPPSAHIHHRDADTLNDSPENLELLEQRVHTGQHSSEWWATASEDKKRKRNEKVAAYQRHRSPAHVAAHAEAARRSGAQRRGIPTGKMDMVSRENMSKSWTLERRHAQASRIAELNRQRRAGTAVAVDRRHEVEQNHRVMSVEPCGTADVYDMEVPEYHNFAANNVFVHNSVYDSFEGSAVAFSGKLDLPTQSESMIGGHAVLAVGYDDTERTLLVRNSWGTDWGMSGHFTMPYDYISNPSLADDLWTIRLVTP